MVLNIQSRLVTKLGQGYTNLWQCWISKTSRVPGLIECTQMSLEDIYVSSRVWKNVSGIFTIIAWHGMTLPSHGGKTFAYLVERIYLSCRAKAWTNFRGIRKDKMVDCLNKNESSYGFWSLLQPLWVWNALIKKPMISRRRSHQLRDSLRKAYRPKVRNSGIFKEKKTFFLTKTYLKRTASVCYMFQKAADCTGIWHVFFTSTSSHVSWYFFISF